jgi:hypothetical protein
VAAWHILIMTLTAGLISMQNRACDLHHDGLNLPHLMKQKLTNIIREPTSAKCDIFKFLLALTVNILG